MPTSRARDAAAGSDMGRTETSHESQSETLHQRHRVFADRATGGEDLDASPFHRFLLLSFVGGKLTLWGPGPPLLESL